ncbi:MAG: hypothetical protein RIR10_504 [Planctomycetota bacterium]|jgi:hypothetical protein
MCTLSIITTDASEHRRGANARACFQLVFNRDEQRTRANGLPLELLAAGDRQAIYPRDPQGGGTWIAVNNVGIAFALLNRNEHGIPDGRSAGLSRGLIIPQLLSSCSLNEIAQISGKIAQSVARGFRLIATDGERVLEVIGGDQKSEMTLDPLVRPFMRASSGLGDECVRDVRAELFESTVVRAPFEARVEAQAAFHNHAWPDRRHLSIRMDRDEARSVSQTHINVELQKITVQHAPRAGSGAESGFAPVQTIVLARGVAC